jgi:hypothetical protein
VIIRLTAALAFCLGAAAASAATAVIRDTPTHFVENRGQWAEPVRFAATKGKLSAAFAADSIRLRDGSASADSLVLRFEGASPNSAIAGETAHPGRHHFYVGNDPALWRSDVPAYASLLYRGLYPGVDMRVREDAGQLEYDLLLAPGAELRQVAIRAEGATRLELAADGALLLHSAAGVLRQSAPRTWEQLPDGTTRPLAANFRIIDKERYGFDAPGRDAKLALVIDPGLEWSTFLGGGFPESVYGVQRARDGSNDIIVLGLTASVDFLQAGFPAGSQRVFVTRVSADGRNLLYTTYLSGAALAATYVGALAVDANSSLAIVGTTSDPTFPVTAGAYQTAMRGASDAFVARLSASGALQWASFLGGSGDEGAAFGSRGVGFEPNGSVIALGATLSADFPTTVGAYDRSYNPPVGPNDSPANDFIARLSANGSQLTYGSYFSGPSPPNIYAAVVDPSGYLTFTGVAGPGLPVTSGALATTFRGGGEDAFVTRMKLDGAGAADLKYSTYLGGDNRDQGLAIAYDPANPELITVAGWTWQDALRAMTFPTTAGVHKPVLAPTPFTSAGFPHVQNGFATRFRFPAAGGGSLVWSTFIGASDWSHATGVAIDENGGPVIVGGTRFYDFPATRGAYDRTLAGPIWGNVHDCFVARLNADASQLLYATHLGGAAQECIQPNNVGLSHIVYLGGNKAVVVAETTSADFPSTPGAFDTAYAPGPAGFAPTSDLFIAKLDLVADASGDLNVDAPALATPANGFESGVTQSNVTLTWNPVADPAGIEAYNYQMSSRPDFPGNFIQHRGSVSGTSIALTDLAQIVWYWRVQAADRAGNLSAWSAPFTFKLGATNPPTAAPSLQAPGNGATVTQPIAFDWSDVSGATRYELQIDDSNGFGEPLVATQTTLASNVSVSGLPASTLWWRVRGANGGGNGPWSSVRSFTVGGAPPPPPPPPPPGTLPAPSLQSPASDARFTIGQTINFDWSDVTGAARYDIQIDDSSSFTVPLTHSAAPTASAYAFATAGMQRMTLRWRVRAVAADGAVGAWSNTRRFELR